MYTYIVHIVFWSIKKEMNPLFINISNSESKVWDTFKHLFEVQIPGMNFQKKDGGGTS